jgi:hypothetical protein
MKRKYFNCVKFKIVGHSSKGIKPSKKKKEKRKRQWLHSRVKTRTVEPK